MAASSNVAMTVAVIGTGEMGSAVGRRLRELGARVVTELRGRSEQSTRRATEAGLEIIDNDESLIRNADFILSIVPPGVACTVAERFREPLSKRPRKSTFVECNAIAPTTVARIEEILSETQCNFVDVGIIGGPPPLDDLTKGPRFYASGPQAPTFANLGRYGLDIQILKGPIGAASALKLAYAGLTKGFTALGAAMISAAARNHVDNALRAELAHSQPDLLKRLDRFVPLFFPKAYRWVAEMEQIAEFTGEEGEGAAIYHGAARLFERIAAEFQSDEKTEWLSALAAFCQPGR